MYAVILAGGSGTRFWPLSRRSLPKQFLPLGGSMSLLRLTVERLFPMFSSERVFVVTAADQSAKVREDLEILPPENIIDEPAPRDTAAAAALFAAFLQWREPGARFCILPSDHFIHPPSKLQAALRKGLDLKGPVTFGIVPTRPATQYGYVNRDTGAFREKPDRETAERLIREGAWLWNSGMFVWSADELLAAVKAHLPEHHAMVQAVSSALGTSRLPAVLAEAYERLPRVSIDHGLMEKIGGVRVLPAEFHWTDVGTWTSLASVIPADASGNVAQGNVVTVDVKDSVVVTDEEHLVAVFGVEKVVVIHTADATLVCPADRAEELKSLISALREQGKDKYL